MDLTGGHENVDAWRSSLLDRFPRTMDVRGVTARQAADRWSFNTTRDGLHSLKIPGGGRREARLDNIYAQFCKGVGDAQLLVQSHAAAGGLLSIAQGGIEDQYAVGVGRIHS